LVQRQSPDGGSADTIEAALVQTRGPVDYAGALNRQRLAMDKLQSLEELFEGRHFDREVIILCVRWCLRFKLSLRDLVEMMAERGLSLAHTTIILRSSRSAGADSPLPSAGRGALTKHTSKSEASGATYTVPLIGAGRTVDFRLSARRDVAAAKAFFRKAMKSHQWPPQTITLDGYAASHRAVRELKVDRRNT
jgi:hypothetical protein